MEIKNLFPANADKRTVYKLTKAAGACKMSNAVGCTIVVGAYCDYHDENVKGGSTEILSIMDVDGAVYATNSPTFRKDFADIVAVFGDELPELLVVGGTSKAGREFVTCTIV